MKDIRERLDKLGQTRMPLWIVGVLAGVLVGLVVPVDKMTIGTVVASPFVALAFWLQPYSIFAPLVIAAMLTHYRFATVIGHWRLEQAISTLGVVGLWKVYRHKLDGTWYRGTVLGGLAAWIAVNAVASLGAPQVFQSEKIVVWLVTDVFVLLLTRQYVTQFGLGRAVRVFYIWGELALLYGLVLFGFHLSQGNLVRAWGSMQESDLYGTFAAIMVLLGLGMLQEVSWENRMRRMVIWASVGISVMALVASGTRSSLLALGGVAIIMAVVERSWRPVLLKTLPLFIAVLALAHIGSQAAVAETLRGAPQRAILAASGSPRNSPDTLIAERDQSRVIVASFVSRLSNITHSYTLAYRLVRVREALQGIVSSTRFFSSGPWH